MNTIKKPSPAQVNASAQCDASRTGCKRQETANQAVDRGGRLVADLSDLFTRRKHGRGVLHLPVQ